MVIDKLEYSWQKNNQLLNSTGPAHALRVEETIFKETHKFNGISQR